MALSRSKLLGLPELPGYTSVAQAAKLFGLSKQGMYYKMFDQKKFTIIYRIGGEEEGERPFLLLVTSEVERVLKEEKQAVVKDPTPEEMLAAWNRRIKDWGIETGWDRFRISDKGSPRRELVDDYVAAHPGDTRPV